MTAAATRPAPSPAGPEGATPYLYISGAAKALDFYQRAFGAREEMRMDGPNGTVGHAEIAIGKAHVMLADENPSMGIKSPDTLGGTSVSMFVYVEEIDSFFKRALEAGATELKPVADQFYGDRSGFLRDPFGHQWGFATHIEDVSPEEMGRRAAAMAKG